MPEPDFKRPFDQPDFRGYFRWTAKLTSRLGGSLYHACHEDELQEILDAEELGLRSDWSLRLPKHGLWTAPGTWTGLNYFQAGNHYGPCLIRFPLSVLNGKHFMVFRRVSSDRHRHFFVQHETRLPIYSFGKKLWRNVDPCHYFTSSASKKGKLQLKPGAIYDIVITAPIAIQDVEIVGVDHPKCISGKCSGCSQKESGNMVKRCAIADWKAWMEVTSEYQNTIRRFPNLVGTKVTLFDPSM